MFETARVTSHVAAQRRFGLFTVSIAVHTAVVAGVVVATVSSVSFPVKAPNEMGRFNPIPAIDLPKPPSVRPQVQSATQPQPRSAVLPANTAPNQIPDVVQPAQPGPVSNANTDIHGVPDVGDGGGGGNVIGAVDAGPTVAPEPDTTIYRPGTADVRSAVVVRRVQPDYPQVALHSRLSGTVVLECVIDRDGNVRDAHVLRSSFAIFEEPALTALRQWKFTPGTMRGKTVETYFELTIAFQPR